MIGVGNGRQRGQGSVEFILFTVILVLMLTLIIQFAIIGVQKWQFNHFAAYSARSWSVQLSRNAFALTLEMVVKAAFVRWDTYSRPFVTAITYSGADARTLSDGFEDVETEGLTYVGVATLMPIFRPFIGFRSLVDVPPELQQVLDEVGISLPPVGLVGFEVYVPMAREPEESDGSDGQKYDNDCAKVPCEKPNGR